MEVDPGGGRGRVVSRLRLSMPAAGPGSEQGVLCALSQVSQAAAELQQYCMQNACKDALLLGVPAGSNPFREPRSCALL
uniref:Guanine nucleotide-binding protein subunit gamma n=1 Tax=Peromyscus maniculatus bairdii TaxID=230844 RepID=A0A8C8T1T3_PERMB